GNYSPNHPAVLLLKQVEKIGYKNADLIVSTLANAKEHVRTVIKKPFDFYYLPMGADLDFYNLASQIPAAGIMEKKPGEFIVGYAGTLGTANALTVIFEAADSLRISHPHIKFAIIGDGPLKAGFQEKYKHLQNIIFFPAVRKMSLQPLLANMDLVINTWLNIPIYRFGISPNKWIDYMFAARPILVAYSGYKGIIDESGCGMFVPAEDKGSLIKAIVQFSEMTVDERTLMGQKGKDYLINNLSYESLCKPYYKILDSIINKKIQVA
ncbi:MAG: glycosyltransferase, partial [Ferruginibacter sp.]